MQERSREEFFKEKTRNFFNQNYDDLTSQLQGREVILQGTKKRTIMISLQGWAKNDVGRRYKGMEQMEPGDWWAVRIPVRKMRQSLIVAKDNEEIGACVRILRASYFDEEIGSFAEVKREGDLANFFELRDNEVLQLKFLDDSETLYLTRKENVGSRDKQDISPDEANQALEKFLR